MTVKQATLTAYKRMPRVFGITKLIKKANLIRGKFALGNNIQRRMRELRQNMEIDYKYLSQEKKYMKVTNEISSSNNKPH